MALDFQPIESTPPEKGGIDFQPTESKIDFQPMQAEAQPQEQYNDIPNPSQKFGKTERLDRGGLIEKYGITRLGIGAGEAAAHLATGMGSFLYHQIHDRLITSDEPTISQATASDVYEPKTLTGEALSNKADEFVNQILAPSMGVHLGVHLPGETVGQRIMADMKRTQRGPKAPDIPPPQAARSTVGAPVPDPVAQSIAENGQGANPYIPSRAPMRVDENGIPVRQDLSEGAVSPAQPDMFRPETAMTGPTMPDRNAGAQAAVDARQAALEQQMRDNMDQVRRDQAMRESAAHAATEQAPTGFDAWQEQMRQDANRRQPGNNEPMDLPRRTYPVDVNEFPQVLQDHQPQLPGMDLTQDTAARMARPFEQDMENPPVRPEAATWEGEGGNTAVQTAGKANPAEAYWNGGKMSGRSPGNRQRGAVNMDLFTPGFEKLKMINNGIQLRLKGGFDPVIQAVDRYGKQVGELKLNTDTFEQKPSSNLQAGYVHVDPTMRGKGIAEQMYRFASEHGDVQADMGHLLDAGRKMWEGFEKRGLANDEWTIPMKGGVPKGQRGAVDAAAVGQAINRSVEKTRDFFSKLDPRTPQEKVLADAVGKPFMAKPEGAESLIAKSLPEEDFKGNLFTNLQSGLQLTGEKMRSTLVQGVARLLSYSDKLGDYYVNKIVTPTERTLAKLSTNDLMAAMKALTQEDRVNTRYTPEEIAQHLSPKAQEAYKQLRAAHDDMLNRYNETLAKQGKPPISAREAYAAMQNDGQWHVPVFAKDGKTLIYNIQAKTRAEAMRAIKWIGENTDLDTKELAPRYAKEQIGRNVPKDVIGAYQHMMKYYRGEPEIAQNMSEAAQNYMENQGFKFLNHDVHFMDRAGLQGVRETLHDRPWLSDSENATRQAKAQIANLKNGHRWNAMQDAIGEISKVLANKELSDKQPNNMKMARLYTAQAMGMTKNMAKDFENTIQKMMSTTDFTPAKLSQVVSSLKSMLYLTQLGLSPGYMIATPLQAFALGPAWHQILSQKGYEHSAMATFMKSVADMKGLFGEAVTDIGKEAFKWAKDNGQINQNIFHENAGLGEFAPVHAAKVLTGATISYPERVARVSTFLSFVHHLDDAGFGTREQIFQRAEELTNHVLTDFRRMSRPLVVDKLGQIGESAYTYKSPIFNLYNNLSYFAREAMESKNPVPFITAIASTALLTGFVGMAGVNELDALFNGFKTLVSKVWPEHYPAIRDLSIKGSVLKYIRELTANEKFQNAVGGNNAAEFVKNSMTHGVVSAATGAQMSSRFSMDTGVENGLLSQLSPVGQELKEWMGASKFAAHPTATNAAEGVYKVIAPPLVKGNMEASMPQFQSIKQGDKQGMLNTRDLSANQTTYFRSPAEQNLRRLGLTSLNEANTKNDWYQNQAEAERWKTAQEEAVDKMFDAIKRGDKEDVSKYGVAFYLNYGSGLRNALNQKIENYVFDPRQKAAMKAQSVAAIEAVERYIQYHNGKQHAN